MTNTRRSLMVFLFLTMVLGVGLFLPDGVFKPVKAQQFPRLEIRSSNYLTWLSFKKPSPEYFTDGNGRTFFNGYFSRNNVFYFGYEFNWVTIAVTVPKPTPGMRNSGLSGSFSEPSRPFGNPPPIFNISMTSPSFSSETSTEKTYYYRMSNDFYYRKGTLRFIFDSGTGEYYTYEAKTID